MAAPRRHRGSVAAGLASLIVLVAVSAAHGQEANRWGFWNRSRLDGGHRERHRLHARIPCRVLPGPRLFVRPDGADLPDRRSHANCHRRSRPIPHSGRIDGSFPLRVSVSCTPIWIEAVAPGESIATIRAGMSPSAYRPSFRSIQALPSPRR